MWAKNSPLNQWLWTKDLIDWYARWSQIREGLARQAQLESGLRHSRPPVPIPKVDVNLQALQWGKRNQGALSGSKMRTCISFKLSEGRHLPEIWRGLSLGGLELLPSIKVSHKLWRHPNAPPSHIFPSRSLSAYINPKNGWGVPMGIQVPMRLRIKVLAIYGRAQLMNASASMMHQQLH